MEKKVTVQIVTFNSEKNIEKCLESVFSQNHDVSEVIIIDNNSQDKTLNILSKYEDKIKLIRNKNNLGFSIAHNQGIRVASGDFILILNPDVVLENDYIKKLLDKDRDRVGSLTGKLLSNKNLPKIIDSTGLVINRRRQAFDRGQGEIDIGKFDNNTDIFGACGAAALYKKEMLEEIKVGKEYFDESFFLYKEDVDIAWRAQINGWKSIFVSDAIAYHNRGWKRGRRKEIPTNIRIHSLKNRYLMLIKNEKLKDF